MVYNISGIKVLVVILGLIGRFVVLLVLFR